MSWCNSQDQKIGFSGSAFVGPLCSLMNAHRDSICHHPMNLHAVDRFSPSWLMSSTANKLLLVVGRWPPFYTLYLHGKMAAPSCPPAAQEDGHPFTLSTCTGRWPPLHTLHLHRKMAAPSYPPTAHTPRLPLESELLF